MPMSLIATLKLVMDAKAMNAYDLERISGVHQPTIHRIVTGDSKDPRSSTIRKLAAALGLTESQLRGDEPLPDGTMLAPAKKSEDNLEIPQFDTGGAMGGGLVLQDQPGVIQSWKVSPEWLRKNVKGYNSAKSLCIVTGFGDSMRPMFNPGDPLLVDISVNTVDFDSIYFFRVGNEGFIKRLQRIPGEGLRVLSANRDNYEPWTIKPDMDFEVFGRVLKVWRSEDF